VPVFLPTVIFSFFVQTGLREIFEIDLVADAGAGRHHREIRNAFWPHFRNS
jgi:hypothetical protein